MSNEVIEGNYAVVDGGGDNIPTVQLEPEYESGERESLAKFSLKAYLAYAMSVVKGRALPRIEDGQKPVQSRILYAMHRMGIDEKTKPVKSARVVGDVIGKLHPHGDSSVYDAMVRMAQGFVLRYPLVNGQGNWGSRDGDTAAAMRYTEARLTNYANLLLAELDLGTVDFVPNYDGEFQEPSVLPARLPMLLLNGASGIAVGMATEVPSHNLTEVAQACEFLIQNPDATLRDIMEIIPAPDFPGGAQIISTREEIAKAYSGRGSIRVRARWVVEPLARNQWQIVVTELPPGASTKSVMTQIESIINPQIKKGQKTLTQEQLAQKALVLSVLDGMRDDSDDENPIRIIFEPPTAKVSADEMMQVLLAHTDLEKNVAMNLVSIGRDGRPKQKNLVQMIKEWIDFRYVTVTRRTQHRLNEVEARIHILEGRMIAFLHIDEVIRVIRDSESPKEDLMQQFGLSETQAEDILEIRLRQLAKLEGIKIERELADLKVEAEKLRHLLANRPAMTKLILSEIQADTKKYGDDRRTLIEAAQKVTLGAVAPATDDPVTVIVSKQGWLRARAGHGIDLNGVAFKAGDELWCSFECQSSQTLVFIGTSGRCYNIGVSLLPNGRSDGAPLTSFIDLQPGCRPVQAFIATPGKKRLFCTSAGYGYIACSEDLLTRQKAGKAFITISDTETVLPPSEILGDRVYALSSGGRMLSFPVSEMKEMPKGKGVMIMDFSEKESLLACVVSGDAVSLTDNHGASAVYSGADLDKFKLHRARKGCQTPGKSKFVNLSPVAV